MSKLIEEVEELFKKIDKDDEEIEEMLKEDD